MPKGRKMMMKRSSSKMSINPMGGMSLGKAAILSNKVGNVDTHTQGHGESMSTMKTVMKVRRK